MASKSPLLSRTVHVYVGEEDDGDGREEDQQSAWLARQSSGAGSGDSRRGAQCCGASELWGSGTACLTTSSLFYAVSYLFVKLTESRVPVFEITLARSALAALPTAALASRQRGHLLLGTPSNYGWLAARGVLGSVSLLLMYAALLLLPMAEVVTLHFTNVAFTALFAWAFRGERMGWLSAGGLLASLAGVLLVVQPRCIMAGHSEPWTQEQLLGFAFALLSAVAVSGAYTCVRVIGRSESAATITLWFHATTLVASAAPLALAWPARAVLPSAADAACMLGVAAATFACQLLVNRGFQLKSAGAGSALTVTQVLFSYPLGIWFFDDQLTALGVAGSVLVGLGVLLVNSQQQQPPAAAAGPQSAPSSPGSRRASGVLVSGSRRASGVDATGGARDTPPHLGAWGVFGGAAQPLPRPASAAACIPIAAAWGALGASPGEAFDSVGESVRSALLWSGSQGSRCAVQGRALAHGCSGDLLSPLDGAEQATAVVMGAHPQHAGRKHAW